jgi:hypothetical protein
LVELVDGVASARTCPDCGRHVAWGVSGDDLDGLFEFTRQINASRASALLGLKIHKAYLKRKAIPTPKKAREAIRTHARIIKRMTVNINKRTAEIIRLTPFANSSPSTP